MAKTLEQKFANEGGSNVMTSDVEAFLLLILRCCCTPLPLDLNRSRQKMLIAELLPLMRDRKRLLRHLMNEKSNASWRNVQRT